MSPMMHDGNTHLTVKVACVAWGFHAELQIVPGFMVAAEQSEFY